MKYFCFRFDVDTHKCLRDGVPNLLNLADELNVKFTFFINFGQSVNLLSSFKYSLEKSNTHSLSAFTKLGLKDYLIAVLINPYIGKKYSHVIKAIVESKHEIGLHGGRNHELWLRDAKSWSLDKIRDELVWGYNLLKNYVDSKEICGFASPGCNGSRKINKVLSQLGFLYVSDIHSNKPFQKISREYTLKLIPMNIVGEPGGIGYIEHLRALGMNDSKILSDFTKKLKERKKLAIVYDHPYYAGIKELNLVKKMIILAKSLGFSIETIRSISKIL